jgi:hypothetical protein
MSKNQNDQRLANRVRTIADERDIARFSYEKLLVPPSVSISDEPTICYQVNREWNKYIAGAISILLEIAVWQDAQDETFDAIQQVSNLLLGSECGDGMNCDDCLSTSDIIKYINERGYVSDRQVTKLTIASEIAAYTAAGNDIQIYNPLVPAVFHDGTSNSQLAFCLVAERFAKDLADRLYNFASFELGLSILTRDIGAALGWAARVLPTWLNAVFKLVYATGLYGVATYEEMIEVVSDESAVNELICQLIAIFEDTTTARASYDAAIASIDTVSGSTNGIKFATMAKTYCANTEAYLYFCNLLGEAQGKDLTGHSCIACVGSWPYNSNWLVSAQSWYPFVDAAPYNAPQGQWVSGTGWSSTDYQQFAGFYARSTSPLRDIPSTYISTISMTYDITKGVVTSTSLTAVAIIVTLASGGTAAASATFASTTNGTNKVFNLTVNANVTKVRLIVRCSTSTVGTGSLTGVARITSVTIDGTGNNPFVL